MLTSVHFGHIKGAECQCFVPFRGGAMPKILATTHFLLNFTKINKA